MKSRPNYTKLIFYISLIIILIILFAASAYIAPTGQFAETGQTSAMCSETIDQEQDSSTMLSNHMAHMQSFIPSSTNLGGISFKFANNQPNTIAVAIYDDYSMIPGHSSFYSNNNPAYSIAVSALQPIPANADWVYFDLPDISTVPGNKYYAVVYTTEYKYFQILYQYSATDSYPGGDYYRAASGGVWSIFSPHDLAFKTYGYNSPCCGDNSCNGAETCTSCPLDCGACPPVCGDGTCNGDETCSSCEADCGICPPICGDNSCNGNETCLSCPHDCGECPPVCGDNVCDAGETCSTCPIDCGLCPSVCGDDVCSSDESCSSCPDDCGKCTMLSYCGNNICDANETCGTCSADCGICPQICGDTICSIDESCSSCPSDCGTCPYCGDGTCNGAETCLSCSVDCGSCACPEPTVDQQQMSFAARMSGYGVVLQSFIPTKQTLTRVDFYQAISNQPVTLSIVPDNGSGSPNLNIKLVEKNIVCNFSTRYLENGFWMYKFEFPGINVIPGNRYYIRLNFTSSSIVVVGVIRNHYPNDAYPNGEFWYSDTMIDPANMDIIFKTYGYNSPCCGDNICNGDETSETCPADCPIQPTGIIEGIISFFKNLFGLK